MPDRRPQAMNLLVVGQSHVAAIRAAAKSHRETYPDEPRTRVIHLSEPLYEPELISSEVNDYGGARLGPKLTAAIEDQISRHQPRVASVIGGNAHNMLALLRHPRPFDFVLAGEAGPPLDPGAELVPQALVRAALAEKMQPDFARIRLLRGLAGELIHIESPPPVRDEGFIAAHAESWFRERSGDEVHVAGVGVRWRIWRLASQLMREVADAAGITFLAVPAALADASGFLKADYAADPTHGNEAYGAALIEALLNFQVPARDA